MKLLGLITEYNPFHNGHLYHLNTAKDLVKPDAVVAVMSGNFLQRGEPAILDKWTRAQAAVDAGVDLVVELPTYFSTASAEGFALGAVALLDRLGATDLVFGAENGDVQALQAVADIIDTPSESYQAALAAALDQGLSFPAARQQAIEVAMAEASSLHEGIDFKANNILGIEYLRAIRRVGTAMVPRAIQRIQNDYNDKHITGEIASATAVRQLLKRRPVDWELLKTVVPETTFKLLWESPVYTVLDDFHALLNGIALREGAEGLRRYRDVAEGLEHKLMAELSTLGTLEDTALAIKSKRYTMTRIQRMLVAILLGITPIPEAEALAQLDYARVLAFNERGARVIRAVKKQGQLYPFTNLGRDLKKYRKKNALLALDIRATGMYAQVNHRIGIHEDFTRWPYAPHLAENED